MNKICGSLLKISEKVADALAKNKPVVALESTIISHGLEYPQNKQCAFSIEKQIQGRGAVPATIAVYDGKIHVGLQSSIIEQIASPSNFVHKVSRRDLAHVLATKNRGATTVSTTMIGAYSAGIDVFVTGGIGGVHRGFESTMDVSADLDELGRTPVTVVSAGVKSILDIPRTLEYLETKGVPVLTYKSNQFPAFFSASSGYPAHCRIDSPEEAAKIIFKQQQLDFQNGVLVAVPNDHPQSGQIIEQAIQKALKEAEEQNIKGSQITPFLLKRLNSLTGGLSLKSNLSLIHNNARVGASIAVALAEMKNKCKESLSLFSMNQNKVKVPGKFISIGTSAVDSQITASPGRKFQLYKSCMGNSRKTFGGVARNIAEASQRLGTPTTLVTALGTDQDSKIIRSYCQTNCGLKLFSVTSPQLQISSARYLAILDENRNQLIGVSQMHVNEELTFKNLKQKYFDQEGKKCSKNDIILIQCIPQIELGKITKYLGENYETSLFFQAKGQKSKWVINSNAYQYVSLLKMNSLEKKQIIQAVKQKFPQITDINEWLVKNIGKSRKFVTNPYTNIKCIVTNGPNQIEILRLVNQQLVIENLRVPAVQKVHKTTGAGDTFTGVFISLLLQNHSQADALVYARAGSKLNLENDIGKSTISEQLNKERLQKMIREQIINI